MESAEPDEESGSCHTNGKGDSGDQRGFAYVALNNVAKKGRRHAQKEDSYAECPFCSRLGKAYVVRDFLTENGPAVDSADAAVDKKRGDGAAKPFVVAAGFFDGFHIPFLSLIPVLAYKKTPHIRVYFAQTVGFAAILPVVNSTASVSRIT